jgi:hypothetical protein
MPAVPAKVTQMYERVKEHELFAITPAPRFERRARYGTTPGLVVSLIVLGIGLAYAVFSVTRLVTNTRASILRTTTATDWAFPMDPFSLALPHINDPSYFTSNVELRRQAPGGRANRTTLRLVRPSENELTYGIAAYDALLAQQLLAGDCRVGVCSYIRVKVYPCQNETSTVPCQPKTVIDDVINSNYLLLNVHGKTPEFEDVGSSYELSLKDALSFRQRFMFDIHQERIYPNYLNTWGKVVHDTLQPEAPIFSIDRLPRLTTGSDTEYCKLDFSLSGVFIRQRRTFTTSLDCLGEIAAFFGAIMGIAALLMTAWNERVFYTKYPHWTAFDGKFTKMPQAVEVTEMAEGSHEPQTIRKMARTSGSASSSPNPNPKYTAVQPPQHDSQEMAIQV